MRKERQKRAALREDIDQQLQLKRERQAAERARARRDDDPYDPWGRAGGGAPPAQPQSQSQAPLSPPRRDAAREESSPDPAATPRHIREAMRGGARSPPPAASPPPPRREPRREPRGDRGSPVPHDRAATPPEVRRHMAASSPPAKDSHNGQRNYMGALAAMNGPSMEERQRKLRERERYVRQLEEQVREKKARQAEEARRRAELERRDAEAYDAAPRAGRALVRDPNGAQDALDSLIGSPTSGGRRSQPPSPSRPSPQRPDHPPSPLQRAIANHKRAAAVPGQGPGQGPGRGGAEDPQEVDELRELCHGLMEEQTALRRQLAAQQEEMEELRHQTAAPGPRPRPGPAPGPGPGPRNRNRPRARRSPSPPPAAPRASKPAGGNGRRRRPSGGAAAAGEKEKKKMTAAERRALGEARARAEREAAAQRNRRTPRASAAAAEAAADEPPAPAPGRRRRSRQTTTPVSPKLGARRNKKKDNPMWLRVTGDAQDEPRMRPRVPQSADPRNMTGRGGELPTSPAASPSVRAPRPRSSLETSGVLGGDLGPALDAESQLIYVDEDARLSPPPGPPSRQAPDSPAPPPPAAPAPAPAGAGLSLEERMAEAAAFSAEQRGVGAASPVAIMGGSPSPTRRNIRVVDPFARRRGRG